MFKLLAIELPTGTGIFNTIITADSKRSIIKVKNDDTICLARAIIVGLAVNNKETFQTIFHNKVTEKELKDINHRRQNKIQINQGILSDNEKQYLKEGRKYRTC